ncbi:fimbrial protein [Leclercia sp. W6]|uniref:fimbrial protein n=1 Tax=Leclercia sp. W6 TaxID=2282310 RepID=UPI000DF1A3AC|nr:fimbrial protein [Leclercia sp. W6]AXF60543.1 fimbrial protein [Leclercia sp. W6]
MKHHAAIFTLALCCGLFSTLASAEIKGTSSLTATFVTTIIPGTCNASVKNAAGEDATDINFGDVFKSDLINKSRVEAFKINFTNCSGVVSAKVTATPGAGGACSTATSDKFGATHNVAFEIWKGTAGAETQLSCKNPVAQVVKLTPGSGSLDMNARIVIADDKTIGDVTTGTVTSPVTFTVTYQ